MEYKSILVLVRENKEIVFYLRHGEDLTRDNIVDVQVFSLPQDGRKEIIKPATDPELMEKLDISKVLSLNYEFSPRTMHDSWTVKNLDGGGSTQAKGS
jgi:hypothetical protein